MNNFNSERFSRIIMKIYLKYNNQRDFAKKSGVSRTYLSQYMNQKLDSPPKPEILQKIANSSKGVTTYQELMQVCGYLDKNETILNSQEKNRLEQILDLANGLTIQETNYLIKVLNKSKIQITKEAR